MGNIQEIIKLFEKEPGKVFLMNPEGEVSAVIMPIAEYKRMTEKKPKTEPSLDTESVNKEILRAQMEDLPKVETNQPMRIGQILKQTRVDLREEVIDPSFDFDSPEDV